MLYTPSVSWVNLVLAGDARVGLLKLAQEWSPEMRPLDGYSMYHSNNMVQVGISKSQPPHPTELADEAYSNLQNVCSCPLRAESSKTYRSCTPSACRKVRLISSSRFEAEAELERVLLHMVILSAGQVEEDPHLSPLLLARVDVLCLCYTIGDRSSLDNAIHKVRGFFYFSWNRFRKLTPFVGGGIL